MKQGPIKRAIKILIIVGIIRPVVWFLLGVNRYSRLKVPTSGPLIIAPNHNSHLDTCLMYALLPIEVALRTRVVAAGDYFSGIPIVSWIMFDFFGMIPVWRPDKEKSSSENGGKVVESPLKIMGDVLRDGDVLLLFPEGTRGEPQARSALNKGIVFLACSYPEVPVYPVFLKGLGKSLPRGSYIFVPLTPIIEIQEPIFAKDKTQRMFLQELEQSYVGMEKKTAHKDRREK